MPTQIEVAAGHPLRVAVAVPGLMAVGRDGARAAIDGGGVALMPASGRVDLKFGAVAVKTVRVAVVPQRKVRLGGQSIGVVARGGGASIVGFGYFPAVSGGILSPGYQAGLRVGDRVTAVDGQPVRDSRLLVAQVERAGRAGRAVRLWVQRDGKGFEVRPKPGMDRQLGRYRIGIYVRDRIAGVGTLTFTDPSSGVFAALGHSVDAGARGRLHGVILPAAVVGVQKARMGRPGRKVGIIGVDHPRLGRIEWANDVGIGGRLDAPGFGGRLLPIATLSQVHPGPAKLYTVLRGGRVEAFAIRIDRVVLDRHMGSKAISLRVTDARLLRKSGGIVQGMSGSPVVQDGRLAAAVSHVLVHDASRGYAVFAEWMSQELASGTHVRTQPEKFRTTVFGTGPARPLQKAVDSG